MNVKIVNVNKWYGDVHALKNIHITMDSGKFTTLLGPSGCGKTTLLRIIAGLETPDTGEIYFDDVCIYSKEKNINLSPQKRALGMVFQEFALWPHMNVFHNVAFSLKARKQKDQISEKVENALKMVRLQGMNNRLPSQMSGGQQQRVAFARAVVSNPAIILFDEPLSALDAVLRDEMRSELCAMVKKMKLTAIYVTHDQIEAMSMSDTIIVMSKGEIIQAGTPEEIYERPRTAIVVDFVGKINWFGCGRKAIRPEKVFTKPFDACQKLVGIIQSITYLGEKYEMCVAINEMPLWLIYHHERLMIGDEINLYMSEKSMINMEQ